MATMTIDRATRDVLYDELFAEMESVCEQLNIKMSDPPAARAARDDLNWRFDLLDSLGWDKPQREEYKLSSDPRLIAWLVEQQSDFRGAIEYEERTLEHQLAGDRDYYLGDHDQEESVRQSRQYIAEAKAALGKVGRLLGQLGVAEAVA